METKNATTVNVLDCGHFPTAQNADACGTGYGTDSKTGKTFCYACAAKRDVEEMKASGRATLYLITNDGKNEVINWPGSLRFPVYFTRTGRHNIAGNVMTFTLLDLIRFRAGTV